MPDYSYENAALSKGFAVVAGTDEAGRGPLCGEVVAAAVILPQGLYIEVYEDRIVITMKNFGTYAGYTPEDLITPYTVWLYQ